MCLAFCESTLTNGCMVANEVKAHVVLCSGELYPCETDVRLCEELATGQEVEVDMDNDVLTVLESGKQYNLKPLGEVRPPDFRVYACPFNPKPLGEVRPLGQTG